MRKPDYLKISVWKSILDESIGLLLAASGVAILVGMFFMMLFASCAESVGLKKKESESMTMARECLHLLADRPETVSILAVSEPDSIYGKQYLNEGELNQLMSDMMNYGNRVFGDISSFDGMDEKQEAMMQRVGNLSDVVKPMINSIYKDSLPSEFSGWKIKILYKSLDQFNDTVTNERYFIFDKDLKYILHSFEIPLL